MIASSQLHSQTRTDEDCYKKGTKLAIKVIHLEKQNDSLNAALTKCKEVDKPKDGGIIQAIKDNVQPFSIGALFGAILAILALK